MAKFPIIKYVDVNGRNVPFSYPTHELKDGNYAKTGENNPLPTKDSDLKTELELIKQQQQQILERLNKPLDTQLTGSNVEELYVFEGEALNSTSTFIKSVDVSRYKNITILCRNTHDVGIQFVVTPELANSYFWDEKNNTWIRRTSNDGAVEIPSRNVSDLYIVTSFFPELKNQPLKSVNIRGKAKETPSEGSMDIYIWGDVR